MCACKGSHCGWHDVSKVMGITVTSLYEFCWNWGNCSTVLGAFSWKSWMFYGQTSSKPMDLSYPITFEHRDFVRISYFSVKIETEYTKLTWIKLKHQTINQKYPNLHLLCLIDWYPPRFTINTGNLAGIINPTNWQVYFVELIIPMWDRLHSNTDGFLLHTTIKCLEICFIGYKCYFRLGMMQFKAHVLQINPIFYM